VSSAGAEILVVNAGPHVSEAERGGRGDSKVFGLARPAAADGPAVEQDCCRAGDNVVNTN
jgi:hypothetical protein